jgi:hypothetical protein
MKIELFAGNIGPKVNKVLTAKVRRFTSQFLYVM